MLDNAPAWVVPAMRAGYLARAVVFGLIGFLIVRAASVGGPALGPEDALLEVTDDVFGRPLLWCVAAGGVGFAAWCFMAAILDLDRRGRRLAGVFARVDFAATGLLYMVIAVFIGELAWTGVGSPGGDEETRERGTAWLLALPAGGWLVIDVGIGFVVAGIWFGYKGLAGRYRERLRAPRSSTAWTQSARLAGQHTASSS